MQLLEKIFLKFFRLWDSLEFGKIRKEFDLWQAKNTDIKSYSQYKQDLFVLFYYRKDSGKNRFFIDIGANDGISLSNTYALEQDSSWGGGDTHRS
ncbi:hypothetical protein ACRE1U_00915 [Helicobacter himalayensis]|uniref:hypothetical protein n=1 Tax=Helicobacter himalayensis TaxID=1591088 RepID=UPI003D6E5E51